MFFPSPKFVRMRFFSLLKELFTIGDIFEQSVNSFTGDVLCIDARKEAIELPLVLLER